MMTKEEIQNKIEELNTELNQNVKKFHANELSFEEFHAVQREVLNDLKYYKDILYD